MAMTHLDDPFAILRSSDRRRLLNAATDRLIGLVLELNRTPRYHNRLDALRLVSSILDLRARRQK